MTNVRQLSLSGRRSGICHCATGVPRRKDSADVRKQDGRRPDVRHNLAIGAIGTLAVVATVIVTEAGASTAPTTYARMGSRLAAGTSLTTHCTGLCQSAKPTA
jgi:hypothetical protein